VLNFGGVTFAEGQFAAVGYEGGIYTSPDGTTFTPRDSGTSSYLQSVVFGNGTFVTVGLGGTIRISPDAVEWSSS